MTYSIKGDCASELSLDAYTYDKNMPTGFCDANWEAPYSASSNFVMCCNAAFIWSVKKQANVALSTVQSELTALSDESCEILYCQKVFTDLNMEFPEPYTIFCDSKGAIENAKHPVQKNRLKHVDIKCFFIRECITKGQIAVQKIGTHDNPSDIGTKLLGKIKYLLFGSFVLNYSLVTRRRVRNCSSTEYPKQAIMDYFNEIKSTTTRTS